VKNMDSTFRDSSSLTEDIGSWNVESVTSIARMFYNAVNFHSDTIGNWNVKSVNTMMSAFRGASSFNGDLSSWSVTSNLTNMQHSFRDAVLFDGNGIGSWYVVFDSECLLYVYIYTHKITGTHHR
jgi:surface protein